MSTTAWVILVGYAVFALVGTVVILYIFRSTRAGFRAEPAEEPEVKKRENAWGILVGLFMVTLLALTIFQIPYFFNTDAKGAQRVTLVGQQYAFTVDPPRVKAGVPTIISFTVKDVSHAAGIYNPNGTLIKQANVLPGVTQEFKLTFNQPGRYRIRCLEFCGVNHHNMQTIITATR
jgi:cytochrome c oxidase subunit II